MKRVQSRERSKRSIELHPEANVDIPATKMKFWKRKPIKMGKSHSSMPPRRKEERQQRRIERSM
nr:MAG TPA: hypothetical protein [Caudoviricetes sp.]